MPPSLTSEVLRFISKPPNDLIPTEPLAVVGGATAAMPLENNAALELIALSAWATRKISLLRAEASVRLS